MVVMAKEAMFALEVMTDLGYTLEDTPLLITDSKSGMDTVVNAGATKHTIHFERWLHYVRDLHLRGKIKITLVGTDQMMADNKTKVVDKTKAINCRRAQMNLKQDE